MLVLRLSLLVLGLKGFVLGLPVVVAAADRAAPEPGTGYIPQVSFVSALEMVVAAHPLAAKGGAEILRTGGHAIDAVIASQMILNLVEPQSSGIGGGGFLIYFDAVSGELTTYDGRETAPSAARQDMFLKPDGEVPGYLEALVGGNSVGAPGLVRMLSMAHRDHGKLPWKKLFGPAINHAEAGFFIGPRLNKLIGKVATITRFRETADYFFAPSGHPKPVGLRLVNLEYGRTLRELAIGGADKFYFGAIAKEISDRVNSTSTNPGSLSVADINNYEARIRTPVCGFYRGFRICGMGPPSSGGIAILQILGILENFDIGSMAPWSLDATHLFLEASQLAFADRSRYIADPDFVHVPTKGLLDPEYLRKRAKRIELDKANETVAPGLPDDMKAHRLADDVSPEFPSTTHISVFDKLGNIASLTSSIEFAFGSALFVRGFLLNNQLTDFSFSPKHDGHLVANRVEPNKRPRSSMAPTIVFDKTGQPFMAIGSPGGSRIICYVAKSLLGVIDWGMSLSDSINQANLCKRSEISEIESGSSLNNFKQQLSDRGHTVVTREMTSGVHAIMKSRGKLIGAADPRREGGAFGR